MGKLEKKKARLQERITYLENELVQHLTKKLSSVKEINVASHQIQIQELKKQFQLM